MPTILIVEDNAHMHRIYADKFRREGYRVLDAFNGEDGITFAEREKPTVVLLDLMMPGVDGFEVMQKLKSNPATSAIPIFVISNKCQAADIERATMLGAVSFFHKGMTLLDDLAFEVRRACKLKKALVGTGRRPVQEAIGGLLSELGYLCSGAAAMEIVPRAERERPDVILLDGQGAGINVLHLLRASAKARHIPLIWVDAPAAAVSLSGGTQVVASLSMPVDPAQLSDALRLATECPSLAPTS
jgi:CheY-like chemotaxis protein